MSFPYIHKQTKRLIHKYMRIQARRISWEWCAMVYEAGTPENGTTRMRKSSVPDTSILDENVCSIDLPPADRRIQLTDYYSCIYVTT